MDKNTVIAFFLIALVIFLWPLYMEYVSPPKPAPEPATRSTTTTTPKQFETVQQPERTPSITDIPITAESQAVGSLPNSSEKILTVDHPLYQAVISNVNGGAITSFYLKRYQKYDSTQVELISAENSSNLLISFVSALDGNHLDLNNIWSFDGAQTTYSVDGEPLKLTFYTYYNERRIEKTLLFSPDTYQIDININLAAISDYISQGLYSLHWAGGLPVTEKNLKDDLTYFKGYAYLGDDLHTPKAKAELKMERLIGQTNWVAIRTKYFVVALIPDHAAPSAEIGGYSTNSNKVKRNVFSVGLHRSASEPSNTKLYLGPLEYKRVKAMGVNLDRIMNFGWSFIRPIAKGVLYLLTKMHQSIPNYGIVLIIFSVMVKILVYPLTKKSHTSAKEMQAVQPLVTELKEKYKNNPQKLNQATMALYKEHGVNPLGGCLPLLLQMPLLISLFQVFRSTIELRGAYFFGWITDLSSPDTIFYLPFTIPLYGDQVSVLPIIMGASMFIQQKMMPTQASGQQKYMSYFMTGFFVLLFNNFPSGLNLYYTLFNVLTILQQKYLTPQQQPVVAQPKPAKKSRKGRK
ncbi:MAG: membrane protein insertase YidC [Candidatus Marinimicrobia bacterium]|nr:membrane protein insertase YidC [Candidatus Neomarinimicrobiota bacterium]